MVPGRSALAILMCLLAVLYAFGVAGRAHQKLFWHDEIVALTLASLAPQQLWAGLLDGTDLNPPLFHLTLHLWHRLGGEGAIASRVPSMAGLAVACLAAGVFVGRSLGWLAGCTAALVLLGTRAYEFAYEVRPYAFVLALAALALVCWQGATRETRHRTWWLLGLLVCCAAALSTHYYAILLPGALGLGEIVRLIESRRPDWKLWAVVTASLAAWVPLLPLITAARSFSSGYFGSPSVRSVLEAYEYMLIDLMVPFTLFLGVSGLALVLLRLDGANDARRAPAPRHETAAGLAMLAAPLLGYAVAVLGTGAFVHRYFLVATLGVSILVPHLLAYLEPYRKHMLLALGGVLLLFLSARDLSSARLLLRAGPDLRLVYPSLLSHSEGSLPLVITNGHVFAVALHYAPPALVSRAIYLFSPRSLQIGGEPRYLQGLSRWNDDLQMERIDTFLRDNRSFLVYGPTPAVLLEEVSRRGGRAVLRAVDVDRSMFAVSRPGSCSLFEVSLP